MKTTGNTILITGGTSGIGLEMAKQLHALGNTILITGRDEIRLAKVAAALPGVTTLKSDVSRPEDIEALYTQVVKSHPKLNVLINNAGIMRKINLHKCDDSLNALTREIDVNLKGPIQLATIFLPHLKSQPDAAIMNVSSGLAFVPLPTSPIYCATKAALHSFTASLRVQLQGSNVRVFELCPPATETELLTTAMNAQDRKGISVMSVSDMVAAAVRGLGRNELEICPGQSNQLRFLSRLAPKFILGQLSKSVEHMLHGGRS
jgi:uncharacterized oxidoreductase